jgi:hypothetical protein
LGNIFYGIFTNEWPFHHEKVSTAQKRIIAGERPPIDEKYRNSTDPLDQAMIQAIEMCWVQDPEERASARQVQTFIGDVLAKQGVKSEKV